MPIKHTKPQSAYGKEKRITIEITIETTPLLATVIAPLIALIHDDIDCDLIKDDIVEAFEFVSNSFDEFMES